MMYRASRAFFLVYYLIAVVIIFNLVIAYVLERYDEQVEFSLARLEAEFGEEKVDEARDIFEKYKRQGIETGGDDVVSVADLRDMLLDLKVEVSEQELAAMLAEYDANHDGVLVSTQATTASLSGYMYGSERDLLLTNDDVYA